ncbi:MAG: two-component system sensor histidine kinase CreC [Lysobacter sp.]|nr:two-component system sensor histidine kinase CreC [Lysobacter sp.]
MKIGLRILLGYFIIVALAALLVARVFVQEVKPGVRQAMEDTLADTANVLAELASDDLLAGRINEGRFAQRVRALRGRDIGAEIWGFEKRSASYRIMITDAKGIVVFDSEDRDLGRDNSRWNDVHRTLRGQYGARSTRSDPNDETSSVMHVAAPIIDAGRIVGVLTVAKPNRVIEPFIARSQNVVMRWGWVLMGVALLVGLAAAWWLSRQLGALRNYADAVAKGERATLPDAAGEFGDLGRALETMRRELEGREYVEQYVQTLTHEMKSPLAAIRGAAELLQEPLPEADRARFAANVQSQGERLTEMIDKLLALAAVEHRTQLQQRESIDVSTLVAGIVEEIAPRLAQAEVTIHQTMAPAMRVEADRFLLRQAIRNLLDNAIEFSASGTDIDIGLRQDDGLVELMISDRGPGIPEFARDRIFERFYSLPRPDGGSRSSGLGLPFVREVASLHGGSIRLDDRPGGGTRAILRLP